MSLPPGGPDLASLSTLDDPVRRRLYEVVTRQPGPVGRDEAAAAAGVGRALAVYHLDKLVESGLLAATYQRPAGRSGPGAGRPAKLYARADREFTVTVPPRSYELAARLLVQAVEADDSGRSRAGSLPSCGNDSNSRDFHHADPHSKSVSGYPLCSSRTAPDRSASFDSRAGSHSGGAHGTSLSR